MKILNKTSDTYSGLEKKIRSVDRETVTNQEESSSFDGSWISKREVAYVTQNEANACSLRRS